MATTVDQPETKREKYATLLDPALWTYIDRVNAWYPPEMDLPVDKQRAVYDAMCRAFHEGTPAGVEASDGTVVAGGHAVAIRHYQLAGKAPQAMVVYYHGGGFVLGGLDSHDDICAEICAGTGFAVLSADYRLAPEHLHPAAFDDALAVFEWAATSGLPVVLCGESAGGNLAAGVAHAARRHPRAAIGQVLVYPELGGDESAGSYVEHAEAPLLTLSDIEFYRQVRSGKAQSPDDPTFLPLHDSDFSGLPPTVIVTAQCDPLSSDGEAYRDRILAAGGRAWWYEEQRLVHSFLRARKTVPRAGEAFTRIVAAIATLGKGDWL
ncbi:alpha/beta hydrolase [Mesorhizobium delmotii]|uniref:Alpha/beta hydrolase fold-3 domain protein n=1 Tax=Mesorhizobium delmotii TaxID=1631247 RepID=A0A2P9AJW5_9HYPH|nr:alpha/beta hydrolase [Mesorhizobium delmotii]SJM31431.1 Alpha/beta hydrolase fold-3 domain protein [Mesorhizobium delmotii]